ncbi:MAG: caspase family protein, partial [Mesorhizobium sp.]
MRIVVAAALALGLLSTLAGPARTAAVKLGDRDDSIRHVSAGLQALADDLRAMPPLKTTGGEGQVRRALVIGIDEYDELTDLNKAIGDADSFEATLKNLGFVVTIRQNIDARAFDDAIDEFVESLNPGDVAFFFFSGHGVSHEQRNFLLPADMPTLDGVRESRLERYAIDAQDLVDRIYARGVEIALVVLDACRDNPFPPDADMRAMRSFGGLQRMTPQKGAFVIYSAGVGQKALDRLG